MGSQHGNAGRSRPDLAERNRTHGLSGQPEYVVWKGMRHRCLNPKDKAFRNYGGRGIAICNRWKDFAAFLADMGQRPSPNHTIERISNSLGYSPKNCRWATSKEQMRNTRATVWIEWRGRRMCREDWAKEVNISYFTLCSRLKQLGWSVDRALSTPGGGKGTNGTHVEGRSVGYAPYSAR